jgi:NADH-quinone oxidoreductase subunit J
MRADSTAVAFAIIALLTATTAVAAMSLRNLLHCVLMLMVTLAGLAALYLQLGAQFIGFAQLLIYIGAVAILIVFAILLTRGSEPPSESVFSATWIVGVAVAVTIFGLLSGMILSSRAVTGELRVPPEPTVRQIGEQLMNKYVLPLEITGLLLTAALIGAAIIAMPEKEGK